MDQELPHVGAPLLLTKLHSQLKASAVDVDLKHSSILNTWVRFKRTFGAERSLHIPPLEFVSDGVYRVKLRNKNHPHRHLTLRLPAATRECFVGFGERFGGVNQRGKILEVWTEEGAIGFGEWLSKVLTVLQAKFNPFPKGPTTAYKPMPWFVSSRGYGVYLDTTYPVFFDVAATDSEVLRADIATNEVDVYLFTGATPKAIVERFVHHLGKPKPLPPWVVGPWNDAVGGSAQVSHVATVLRREKIPSSAIWTEDWAGGDWSNVAMLSPGLYNINPVRRRTDRGLYPDLEALATRLHGDGFKFLGYYYPFIPDDDPDFNFAAANGYLLRNAHGSPLAFPFITGKCGQIDLTNPAAKAWYAAELRHGIALGFDGWMADFGEYTPIDSRTASGETGLQHHNAYPKLWAELNREVWEKARPDGDYVFISRSGAAGQQAASPVFWSGDSNTNMERWDGLPSNLSALLSAAWSGIPVWTTDLGGYMSLWTRGRDAETLARWTEFAAFLPVMRTHHGTHPKRSVQFDHSAATLEHYRIYARLHLALYPLLRILLDEATQHGTPVCRPLLFEFAHDDRCWEIDDAYMLGPDLLVAPVVERGATTRILYLPAGHEWIDLWTGEHHQGGQEVVVPAPLGQIPLFLRNGGYLILFDRYFDTLVPRRQVARPETLAYEDGDASVSLLLSPGFTGEGRLHDGGTFTTDPKRRDTGLRLEPRPPCDSDLLPLKINTLWQSSGCASGQDGSFALNGAHGNSRHELLSIHNSTRIRQWTVRCPSMAKLEGATDSRS